MATETGGWNARGGFSSSLSCGACQTTASGAVLRTDEIHRAVLPLLSRRVYRRGLVAWRDVAMVTLD